ncbi:terpene synthase family protein [Umezawaea endophytica]|uniref:Terpene synthase n=1 Tax=Umezawaea endophytica TaxID=1654476 RepID=A0A9X2VWC9_9PSEU|nr:terpene synthase family protein [Umezawaea endophytica]MCS7483821.1 terpene synthase family protein [Umezawaea endophytica]
MSSDPELREFGSWPSREYPVRQLTAPAAHWAEEFEQLLADQAGSYGLITGDRARLRLIAERHGELAARAYSAARPDRLTVIARWFNWMFFLDDMYDGPIGQQDDEPAHRELLSGMAAAMPLRWEQPAQAEDPLRQLLADLWLELSALMTTGWMTRFHQHVMQFLAAFRHESLLRARRQTPGMRVFEEVRWPGSAMPACIDMIEVATGIELPLLIQPIEPYQKMVTTTADCVSWLNDVLSLRMELACAEVSNIVLVLMQDNACDVTQAADMVHHRTTLAVQRFLEAEQELRLLCTEWPGLTETDHTAIDECVAGMKRWMRGSVDWSENTARYRISTVG